MMFSSFFFQATATQIVTSSLHNSPNTKWAWLRLGLLQMSEGDYNLAETRYLDLLIVYIFS